MDKEHIDTVENKMAEAEAAARNYFKQGLNCSECVYQTILDLYKTNLPQETICLASGFGGGMGHTKNTCGAISGAVLALGLIKGRKDPFEKETLEERAEELKDIYAPFADMINEIENTYGTLICRELSAPHGEFDSRERKKNCQKIIGYCASLVAKYAEKTNNRDK